MSLAPGTRLGPYEILAALGAGGMGEVWKAKDTRLDRFVAVKVLPAQLSKDGEALARFEREAKTVAALSHPNILALHDIGKQDDVVYAVMELLEGESLRARLAPGPLPARKAIDLAVQIARGLAAAHEKGVVHRDLKPDNLWITPDGRLKILDFGLAKQIFRADPGMHSQFQTTGIEAGSTGRGTILGTIGYMSPEQVRGESVDARSDIFSFGAVLFEMLTGTRAFARNSATETLAAILRDDPPTPETTSRPIPAGLERIIHHCLEKSPDLRFRSAHDVAFALENLSGNSDSAAPFTVPVAPESRRTSWKWAALALLLVLAGSVAGWVAGRGRPGAATSGTDVLRLAFLPPSNLTLERGTYQGVALSPDGRKVVFAGRAADGRRQLWVCRLDSREAQLLPDTLDAIEPFWSPDSQTVGFGAQGKLKRVDLGAARAQTLCDAARLNTGSSWSRSGVIVFNPDYGAGLFQIPAAGGTPAPAVPHDPTRAEGRPSAPSFLPDGRHFLYTADEKVFVGAIDSTQASPLPGIAGTAVYASPGWLIHSHNGVLVAQAFDPGRQELRGDPLPISTASADEPGTRLLVSVSDNGRLLLQRNRPALVELAWFDRQGTRVGAIGSPTLVTGPQLPGLSPEGKRVVIQRADLSTRNQDIWVSDAARDSLDRLTTDPALDQTPLWSADGRSVFFMTRRQGAPGIYEVPAAGGTERLLVQGIAFPSAASPDGRFVLFTKRGEKTRLDVWALPLFGDHEPHPILDSEFEEEGAQLSPDGRWLAYASDVNGRSEIYVRPFTAEGGVGAATRVSMGGGRQPRWRRDGGELFYLETPSNLSDGQLMAVPVRASSSTIEIGAVRALFKVRTSPYWSHLAYDVTADGQRFLVDAAVGDPAPPSVDIVLNWPEALKN